MYCKLCRKEGKGRRPAVYAPLRICKEHFLAYFEKKVRKYLESVHVKDARLLIGVSGGKDSAALAGILHKIKDDYGLELALFTIDLKIPDYSEESLVAVQELAKKLDLPLHVMDLGKLPKQIPDFTKGTDAKGRPVKPCSACGVIKRYHLNKAAVEGFGEVSGAGAFDFVVTGHNLDDEYYFAMHSLEHQQLDLLLRGDKHLPPKLAARLAGKLKPLYYVTEKENMIYCLLNGLPVHNKECPFSVGNPQIAFKQRVAIGVSRDKKSSTLKTLRKLKRMIPDEARAAGKARAGEESSASLNACPECGYPTTREEACVYCKLMQK